jgi:pimeloyl-ACP methyl ester carboxylesterase
MARASPAFRSAEGEAAFRAAYDAALARWPVPYETMDIVGRYGGTHLVACGPATAPPLVLLHGFSATLTMWSANIAELSRAHRVYAIDVMGQPGLSTQGEPLKSRADCVGWLASILDALRIERASVVGMSYGGWLALNFAIAAPDRVDAVALLSPAGSFVSMSWQLFARALLLFVVPTRAVAMRLLRWFAHPTSLADPQSRRILESMADLLYLGARHFRLQRMTPPGVFSDGALRGVRVPTLVLIGAQEVIYDPAAALARARALIPALEGDLVPDARHDMAIGRHEVVDRRILEFLERRRQPRV